METPDQMPHSASAASDLGSALTKRMLGLMTIGL